MNRLFSSKKLWRRLTVSFCAVIVIFAVLTQVAFANSALINSTLNITDYKVISDEDDDSDYTYFASDYTSADDIKEYGNGVCEEVEGEGIVLLKNENEALPLDKGSNVSCFFYGAVNLNYSTSGSSSTDTSSYSTLQETLTADGFNVNSTLWDFYSSGDGSSYSPIKKYNSSYGLQIYSTNAAPWSVYTDSVIDSIADYNDAAIFVISRQSGEGMDVSTMYSDGEDGSYLSITEEELSVLQAVSEMKAAGTVKKLIVLLNMSNPFEMSFLEDDSIDVDACMWVGNLGSAGVNAVSDVLTGDVVPSGRLPDTYVKDNFSSPVMETWGQNDNGVFAQTYSNATSLGLGDTSKYYGVYSEGIYVGYRYYETRYEDTVMSTANVGTFSYGDGVAYPFGYGLSYTEFEYSNFTVEENEEGDYDVSVKVTNIGNTYSGKETVQIYLQKPYTDYDMENGIEKSSVELVGFGKTEILAPQESATVGVTIEKSTFKSYDHDGYGTYILDEGDYYLAVGENAHDALNNILAAKGYGQSEGMDADGDNSFAKIVFSNPALDATTYSVSEETGAEITNQLDFCDVNNYEGSGDNSVTYLSRSDWTGTWPELVSLSVATSTMEYDLSSYKDIEEEEGAETPTYSADNGLNIAMLRSDDEESIEYDDERWDDLLDQLSFGETSQLVTDCSFQTPAIESVGKPGTSEQDGPTGVVGSVTSVSYPSEGIWAATFNIDLISKIGDALAEDARINDLDGLYLPGINIHRSAFGGRTHEYFSEDPYLTGVSCQAEIEALQAKGVIPCVKHFIFNDEESQRNGIGVWLNEQSAREIYLKPWEYAVGPSYGNAHAVMSSFNRAGCIWTSASSELVQNVLRGEMGFDGYIITDMASSNAASFMTYVDGFMNGTDCYLGSGSTTALDEYKSSPTFCNMIRESAHRILYIVANYSVAMNGISSSDQIVSITPWWGVTLYCVIGVFAVLAAGSAAMMVISYVNVHIKKEEES